MNKYSSLKLISQSSNTESDLAKISEFRSQSPKCGISIFSMNENFNNTKSSLNIGMKEILKFPQISRSPLPSERNFSDLLDKLDQITVTRYVSKDSMLSDGDEIEVVIEQDAFHYIRVQSKGKKNPLKVNINGSHGRVLVYTSYVEPKPSYSNCDKTFNMSSFEVRTFDTVFKCDFIYMALRAVVYAKVTVHVSFGRKHHPHHALLKKNKNKNKNDLSEDRIRALKLMKKKHFEKNFVLENLNKRMLSPDELKEKEKIWKARRELAINNKKKFLEDKKQRALDYINKQKIRKEQAKIQYDLETSKNEHKQIARSILKTILLLKSAQAFNSMRLHKRQEISRRLTTQQKVRKIQNYFKRSSTLNIHQTATCIAQQNLLIFRSNLLFKFKLDSVQNIVKIIKDVGSTLKPFLKISGFLSKVVLIQQQFRRYLEIRAERLRKLILFWDECRSFQKRRSIKKKTLVHELSISIGARDEILSKYYQSCVQKYYESVRMNGIFISEIFNKQVKRFIRFEYMPTTLIMKQIIESV